MESKNIGRKNLDEAFEEFQVKLKEMSDEEFWGLLGTSVEELKKLAELDTEDN